MDDNYPSMRSRANSDRITIKTTGPRREVDVEGWEHDAWKVTLTMGYRTLTTPYKMGTGHGGDAPDRETVLDSLCSDAAGADQTFEDWASDYGYDTDSRKAEAVYRAVVAQTKKLRAFLGDKFDAYVYETERL